ncbi:hypothetical protein FRC12_019612, partial [Ceratobasidium sp. 428]
ESSLDSPTDVISAWAGHEYVAGLVLPRKHFAFAVVALRKRVCQLASESRNVAWSHHPAGGALLAHQRTPVRAERGGVC